MIRHGGHRRSCSILEFFVTPILSRFIELMIKYAVGKRKKKPVEWKRKSKFRVWDNNTNKK
jgi:hypothetical protein